MDKSWECWRLVVDHTVVVVVVVVVAVVVAAAAAVVVAAAAAAAVVVVVAAAAAVVVIGVVIIVVIKICVLLPCVVCRLSELEHTRDELFIQLYHSEDAFVDKNTVSCAELVCVHVRRL